MTEPLDPVTAEIVRLLDTRPTEKENTVTNPAISTDPEANHAPIVPFVASPDTTQPVVPSLRDFATSILDLIKKAETPLIDQLHDEAFRKEVCAALSRVRGWTDDVLPHLLPRLTWEDVSEQFTDDAAEDDAVRDEIIDNLEWPDLEKRFSEDLRDHVNDAIENMDTDDLVSTHGAENFADHDDVKRRVFRDADVDDVVDAIGADVLCECADVQDAVLDSLSSRAIAHVAENSDVRELVLDTLTDDDWKKLSGSAGIREYVLRSLTSAERARYLLGPDPAKVDAVSAQLRLATGAITVAQGFLGSFDKDE